MNRDFAPLRERLLNVTSRLEQFPRFFEQVRSTLRVGRVPEVHARTAVAQNQGILKTIDNFVRPSLGELSNQQRARLEKAIQVAESAIGESADLPLDERPAAFDGLNRALVAELNQLEEG